MIDKSVVVEALLERLDKLEVGHCLDVRTYKRNRSVVLIKTGESDYHIIEDGFCREEFTVDSRRLKRTIKELLKKEFPRSRKVRVYALGPCDPVKFSRTPRKTI